MKPIWYKNSEQSIKPFIINLQNAISEYLWWGAKDTKPIQLATVEVDHFKNKHMKDMLRNFLSFSI